MYSNIKYCYFFSVVAFIMLIFVLSSNILYKNILYKVPTIL